MPYIEKALRKGLDRFEVPPVEQRPARSAGELAYTVSVECIEYLDNQPTRGFLAFATCIGVMICVVLEIYRRRVAPYEDLAKVRNGDVRGMGR